VDAPSHFEALVEYLSSPRTVEEAVEYLAGTASIDRENAGEILEQFVDAGIAGPPIPSDSRYARHLLYFDMLGTDHMGAQDRLGQSTVGIVGAGGIGSNVASLLAAAGVGNLVITDGDEVELSNLTRQVLYSESDIGRLKVDVAAERLGRLNSSTVIKTVPEAAHERLFDKHLASCDAVVLSADSPDELHEWIDAASRRHGFAYLAAGYVEAVGSVGPLVVPGLTACFECFRSVGELEQYVQPGGTVSGNLNAGMQAGSYGPLNFLVAAMAANEIIRCLLGLECASAGARLMVTSDSYELHTESFSRNPNCVACGDLDANPRWEGLTRPVSLEDTYAVEREGASVSSVVLDPLVEGLLNVDADTIALDFGCGTGVHTSMLAARGASVVAYDVSAEMLDLMSARLPEDQTMLVRTVGASKDLMSYGGAFDLILCLNVLDHVETVSEPLGLLRRLVKPTGQVILSVPHPLKDGARWRRTMGDAGWEYSDVTLATYFEEGRIVKPRLDKDGDVAIAGMTTHHRTISHYFSAVYEAGFDVVALYEPKPDAKAFKTDPDVAARTARVPYFLVFTLAPRSV
jgi:molybdopterin/thiamine biosynthesis adenylyltransferase/SAM-dependent methyltransferase